jgi:outer membrane protein insertion porin family
MIALLLIWVQGAGLPPAIADEELDYGLDLRALDRIEIEGNRSFADEELLAFVLFDRAPWYDIFGRDRYRADQIRQSIGTLRNFYRGQGFHRADLRLDHIEEREFGGDVVVITVDEGRRTIVERVDFVNPQPLSETDLLSRLTVQPGGPSPASRAGLGADLYRILDSYLVRGHLGARVQGQLTIGDSTATIVYTIKAGPKYRVRAVRVEGERRTARQHIERELQIEAGDPFDAAKIARTEAELLDTGWFRDVSFRPADLDSSAAEADLVVRVVERETGFYELGVGTGDEERVRLSAGWGDRNVFRSGRSVTVRGRLALVGENRFDDLDSDEYNLDHREEILYRSPRVFGSRFDLNLNAFFRKESRPRSGVELERWGLLANTILYSRRATTVALEAGVENVLRLPLGDVEGASSFFPNRRAQTRALSVVWGSDTRDDYFNPQRGTERQLLVQFAGGPWFGGDNTFNKALGSWTSFLSVPGGATLGFRAQAGWAKAWWNSKADGVPFEDRFFAGGNSSVRGYQENSLGPRATAADIEDVADEFFLANRPTAGGGALLLSNAELRFPLPLLGRFGFSGSVFLDGGNVWEDWSEASLRNFSLTRSPGRVTVRDYRLSYGFGVQYNTLVGPLRLDYGVPLHRAEFVDELGNREIDPSHLWHFSLGHAF